MSSPSTADPTVTDPPGPETIRREAGAVLDSVASVVVGRERSVRLALAGVLAGGHVMFEDVPGLGKTLLARALAQSLGLEFRRVQCTPDLQPADITGSFIYDPADRDFTFRQGPVFAGLLLADEINRTPPKTQAALLEAMQERQVTVEGRTFPLPQPFHVLATANPIEYEGTYPLPEAQLDRFLLRLGIGYPPPEEEAEVLRRRLARRKEEVVLDPVIDATRLAALQAGLERVDVDDDVLRYCVDLANATRGHRSVEIGASPRGSQALLLVSRALAVLAGRDFVVPEDIKECAVPALAHRLTMRAETWSTGVTGEQVVNELLGAVPTPSTTRSARR